MKNEQYNKTTHLENNITGNESVKPIIGIGKSILNGLAAYVIVFSFVVLSKLFSLVSNFQTSFSITSSDILIPFWGFIVFSFIVFVSENRKE